jgi:hypothetical protein
MDFPLNLWSQFALNMKYFGTTLLITIILFGISKRSEIGV